MSETGETPQDEPPGDTETTPHARTVGLQSRMLTELASCGNISQAARAAGIHRATHHGWVASDPIYAQDAREAMEMFKDTLRAEITRRARDGWDEVRFDRQGNQYTVRMYSDRMMELQAKALMPEYRDGARPSDDDPTRTPELELTRDEKRAMRQALDRARAGEPVSAEPS